MSEGIRFFITRKVALGLISRRGDIVRVPKFTTRPLRLGDSDEMGFCGSIPRDCDIRYQLYPGGGSYGISSEGVRQILASGRHAAAIVGPISAVRRAKEEFGDTACTIWLDRWQTEDAVTMELRRRGLGAADVAARLRLARQLRRDYEEERELFDLAILNDGSQIQLVAQFAAFLARLQGGALAADENPTPTPEWGPLGTRDHTR